MAYKKSPIVIVIVIVIRAFRAQYMSRAGVAQNDLPVRKSQTLLFVKLLISIATLQQSL